MITSFDYYFYCGLFLCMAGVCFVLFYFMGIMRYMAMIMTITMMIMGRSRTQATYCLAFYPLKTHKTDFTDLVFSADQNANVIMRICSNKF